MVLASTLLDKINQKEATVGIIGMGYVGLPLAMAFAHQKFPVVGFDVDQKKCDQLMKGSSYIKHIPDSSISHLLESNLFKATSDMQKLQEVDVILICVPTPLNKHREPNLDYIIETGKTIGQNLQKGQLIVLESTTYPGTTEEQLLPVLIKDNELKVGEDFFLAYSPEREDPNNENFQTSTIPKVVGGHTPTCLEVSEALYSAVISSTVPVTSTKAAEASKILENTYRSVNIAMVNELKVLFDRMDIDVWEVIEAAKTKPFGFQAFYPGPGLGGHCIPIDPFYLTWKAREYDYPTRFIELAGEVNSYMPYFVLEKCIETLNQHGLNMGSAKILILGVAYKKNIDDMRESPSLKLIQLLSSKGAEVSYHDPHVKHCADFRHYPDMDMYSTDISPEEIQKYDLILVSTDHDEVDYDMVARNAKAILDTRNVFHRKGIKSDKIFKA